MCWCLLLVWSFMLFWAHGVITSVISLWSHVYPFLSEQKALHGRPSPLVAHIDWIFTNLLVYFLQETVWPSDSWDIAHSVVRMMQSSNPFLFSLCVHFWLTGNYCPNENTHQSSKDKLQGRWIWLRRRFSSLQGFFFHFFLTGRDPQVFVGYV